MTYLPAADRYQPMPYRRCGRSGLQLPAFSLVLWNNFGDQSPLETTIGYEQVAIEVTANLAQHEPDPYLKQVMDFSNGVHFSDGHLNRRTKEMIATYVSGLNQCPY